MIGSFGPKADEQEYTFPAEQCPSGMMSRGSYTVTCRMLDDDGAVHLNTDYNFQIKKVWA